MRRKLELLSTLVTTVATAACGGTDSPGDLGVEPPTTGVQSQAVEDGTLTTTPVVFVCSGSTAFYLTIDVTAPESVEAGVTFPVTLGVRNFFTTPAPFGGTLTSSVELSAVSATPTSSTLPLPVLTFPAGQPILDLGTATTNLTASAGPSITLRVAAFDYTIQPDNPANNPVVAHCVPPDDQPDVGVITVSSIQVPESVRDCKHGGWRNLTDDEGNPFENQGACIRYVRSCH